MFVITSPWPLYAKVVRSISFEKMFDRATAVVVNRRNARRSWRTVGCVCSVHSEHRSATSRRQLRIDVHDFLLSAIRLVRVGFSHSLLTVFIGHNDLRYSSRGVVLIKFCNRDRSALLGTLCR